MTGFENHAGFTISASRLQIVEVIYKSDQFILENVDEAYFNEPLNLDKDKETKIGALLQAAYNELLLKHPLKSTSVSFTLPFELFYIMQVPYDNTLLNQDLVEEFKWEFSILYPFHSFKDLVLQYIEIDKNDFKNYNSAVVVALQRKFLQVLYSFCSHNNLKLKFVDNVHIASDRAMALSSSYVEKGLVFSIYFSNKYLSFIFSSEGKPVHFNVIRLNDISEVPALIKDVVSSNYLFPVNKNMIDAIFITGEDLSPSIVQTLRNSVELDLIYFNPFEKIKPEQKLFNNKYYSEKPNSFSSAAGIAFRLA